MARTNSKAKKTPKREKSINKIRLPQQLTQLPALKFIPLPCMSNLGKVKLWLPSTPCNARDKHPWPQLALLNSTDEYHYNHLCNPYGLYDDQQQPNGSHWHVVKVEKSMISPLRFSYPRWHWDGPLKYTSRPISHHGYTQNAMDVILTYDSSPALMVYCFNERDQRAWIRHECNLVDPFDAKGRRMQFTRVIIGNDDKIYALSLQGALAVMEDVDSRLVITAVSSARGVPSVSSRYFKEYFVKLNNGDILLVFLICKRSHEVVDEVEVFRLCFDKLKWIKVERLDGKALFLDKCGIWVNSEEVGCKKNCVYFTQGSDNGWWVYDVERRSISPFTHVDKLRKN